MAKSSKQLLRATYNKTFKEVQGEIITVSGIKCFIFRQSVNNHWCVSEYSTGTRVFEALGINMNKRQTIECARLTLKDKGPKAVAQAIASKLLSLPEPANV